MSDCTLLRNNLSLLSVKANKPGTQPWRLGKKEISEDGAVLVKVLLLFF